MVPKKVSLQLSSKQSISDIWIAQLDRLGLPAIPSQLDGLVTHQKPQAQTCIQTAELWHGSLVS